MFKQHIMPENFFLREVLALRESAQVFLRQSPIPHGADSSAVASIALLQNVLAAEILCVLRYTMISVSQDGLQNGWIGAEFQAQANDERKHMQMAAGRIAQLGGTPNFNPDGLAARIAALGGCQGGFAKRMVENLAAEQSIIAHYRDLIAYFSARDPQTCAMLQEIIMDEEDHTSDLQDILGAYMA